MVLTPGETLRRLQLEVAVKPCTGCQELLQALAETSLTNFVESSGHNVVGDEAEDDEQDFVWQVHEDELAVVRRCLKTGR